MALATCVALGVRARSQTTTARADAQRLEGVARSVQQFEAAFRPVTDVERKAWSSLPDSGALGIAPDGRLGLTESVARMAEQSGLAQSRVSLGPADTAVAAQRAPGDGDAVLSNYTITVDAEGGFAELLTFVNALPVTVSVAHLKGRRDSGTAHFHVVLAVYENKDASHS